MLRKSIKKVLCSGILVLTVFAASNVAFARLGTINSMNDIMPTSTGFSGWSQTDECKVSASQVDWIQTSYYLYKDGANYAQASTTSPNSTQARGTFKYNYSGPKAVFSIDTYGSARYVDGSTDSDFVRNACMAGK